jgi:hypothetical protein
MWELHDESGNYVGPVRGVVQDKLGNEEKLEGLTSDEVQKMKRVTERLHGSYRTDERIPMELNLVGQWLLQFKRYLPGIIKNTWRDNFSDRFLGEYKIKLDENGIPVKNDDNMDVYEWEEMKTTGRIRLFMGVITQIIAKRRYAKSGDDTSYLDDTMHWENLSDAQKADLHNIFWTFAVMLISAVFALGVDDDDKDDALYLRFKRLSEDLTLGLNPLDIIRPVETPFIAVKRVRELIEGVFSFLGEGLILGKEDSRGWTKGSYTIFRNLPVGSMIHGWDKFMHDVNPSLEVLSNFNFKDDTTSDKGLTPR